MTRICLVRHGETDWNQQGKLQGRTDIPLNASGCKQASECRDYLEQFQWDVLITSPLLRAKATADIINTSMCLPLVTMKEFLEVGFGDAEGMTLKERDAAFPNGVIPNREQHKEVVERIELGLQRIVQNYPNQKVLLVSHGATLNVVLHELSSGTVGTGKTALVNGSFCNLRYHSGAWAIENYNQLGHLSHFIERITVADR